jgi:type I restriction enzyme, R subunit
MLEPFAETVQHRFYRWLEEHEERTGKKFTVEQKEWLEMIKNHIATSLSVNLDDFELQPFQSRGGAVRVYNLFGSDLPHILNELNEMLVAT